MRFLLIEDNEKLAAAIVERLGLDGHVVDHAPDLETAADCLAGTGYELILLDIMLPDGDGRNFLEWHRTCDNDTPVIVLTARSEVSAPDMIFSKSHLVDRLFSYDEEVSENAIEVYVGRVRKKLQGGRVRIETVRGVGYRMTAT
ncbi:response regulator transcription factor [Roseibium album]|uniref:response regulator transcription factor n=1 Tax=Roseibium album TaxID=311410 RepID=UPI003BB0BB27